jgi:two-component system alkaline phosphatase synthesis response regulator PhoP
VARIAIISSPNPLFDLVQQIVVDEGWHPSLIDGRDLDRRPGLPWSLVIIISVGTHDDLVLLAAQVTRGGGTPVMVIADDRDPQLIADVLRSGVVDFLVAPFHPLELSVRMHAHINRSESSGHRRREVFVFDFASRTISSGPMFLALSNREWDVLIQLLDAGGVPVSASDLGSQAGRESSPRAVASVVARLRHHLERSGFGSITISTIRGRGYSASVIEMTQHDQHRWVGRPVEPGRLRVIPGGTVDFPGF